MPEEDEDIINPDIIDDEELFGDTPKGNDPKLKDAIAKKQYWREKAEKEKAENENLKKRLDEATGNSGKALDIATDLQLKQQFNLDEQDLKVAKGLAAGSGKTVAEMLSDKESDGFKAFDTFQTGKTAKKSETNVISEPSSRVPVVGDKSFSELDDPDKKKNYTGSVDALIKKARSSNRNNLS